MAKKRPLPKKSVPRKKKNNNKLQRIVLIAILLLLILLVGMYFTNKKPADSLLKRSEVNVTNNSAGETVTIPNIDFTGAPEFHAPTRYLYSDTNGNIHIGALDGSSDITIFTEKGIFGGPVGLTASPDGKYLAYGLIPESELRRIEQNAVGDNMVVSDEYALWIMDTKTYHKKQIDQRVLFNLYRTDNLIWKHDSSGFYYDKEPESYQDPNQINYAYDLETGTSTHLGNSIRRQHRYFSPDNSQKIELVQPSSHHYGVWLTDIKSGGPRTEIYRVSHRPPSPHFYDASFVTPDKVLVTRSIPDAANNKSRKTICILEALDVNTRSADLIGQEVCELSGYSTTGFIQPKLSPDRTKIVLNYVKTETKDSGEGMFNVYDLESGKKHTVGEQDVAYSDYYFISDTEIIAASKYLVRGKYLPHVYNIDLRSGDVKTNELLEGKYIFDVF